MTSRRILRLTLPPTGTHALRATATNYKAWEYNGFRKSHHYYFGWNTYNHSSIDAAAW
jgi:hypothetical protein